MSNETQVKQEGGGGTSCNQGGCRYINETIVNKYTFESNIVEIKDAMFTQGNPHYAENYEDSNDVLTNYIQREYSDIVYPGKDILD